MANIPNFSLSDEVCVSDLDTQAYLVDKTKKKISNKNMNE